MSEPGDRESDAREDAGRAIHKDAADEMGTVFGAGEGEPSTSISSEGEGDAGGDESHSGGQDEEQ